MSESTNNDDTADNDLRSGDEIYSSLGLDALNGLSTTVFLVPALGGGPAIPSFRVEIEFVGGEIIKKNIPLDELLMMIRGLTNAIDVDTIRKTISSIALLNSSRNHAQANIKVIRENIDGIERFLNEVDINNLSDRPQLEQPK